MKFIAFILALLLLVVSCVYSESDVPSGEQFHLNARHAKREMHKDHHCSSVCSSNICFHFIVTVQSTNLAVPLPISEKKHAFDVLFDQIKSTSQIWQPPKQLSA